MNILVTGGAGYIGSHAVRALLKAGHHPVVLDNLERGHRKAVPEHVPLIVGAIEDDSVATILQEYAIEGIMHFAAHSQVGESMQKPSIYYENNVVGTYRLLEAARKAKVNHIVFSSTAAVYGEPEMVPIVETAPKAPTNVYGRTKWMIEQMLQDYSQAYGNTYVALRYFNAAGASPTGDIGEDHTPETHLIPLILEAALGQRENISIFGTDYKTPDGTCIRDYIHVDDLASAHIVAMEYLAQGGTSTAYNLGTGEGVSVREMIETAKAITDVDFPVKIGARRPGDPAVLVASHEKIKEQLGWYPQYSQIDTILKDAWHWHKHHLNGYEDK